jgi:protein-tyrosine-phosphatase
MSLSSSARRAKVLFVCTGNTCRSVLAEYLGRRFCEDALTFESAGISPQRAADAENAVFTLKKTFGIDASAHQPRDVRAVDLNRFDLVIAIENNAAAVVRELGVPESRLQVWTIQDPWGGDLTEYAETALEIRKRLARLKRASKGE